MFKPADLFDLSQTDHAALFDGCTYAWEALKKIKAYVEANTKAELRNKCEGRAFIGDLVFIGEGTVVEDGAMIKGPAIIGRNCQMRHNAYIREHVIVGDGCVVGNSSELKNVLLFNGCQVPHFNYLGDTILGYKAHVGAGVPESLDDVEAAAVAEPEVNHGEGRRRRRRMCLPGRDRLRGRDKEAPLLQGPGEAGAQGLVVVDDQKGLVARRLGHRALAHGMWPPSSMARSQRTTTLAPPSGRLSKAMAAPPRSRRERAMKTPRPIWPPPPDRLET